MTSRRLVRERDSANMLVIESILLGLLLIGGLYYVMSFSNPTSDTSLARSDIELAGRDAMVVIGGLTACDELSGAARGACEDVYGESMLKRSVTEALTGEPKNLTLKLRTLLPPGVRWNLYLDNGVGTTEVHLNTTPDGERVTATHAFTPEWNHTVVVPQRSLYQGSPSRDNPMVVYGLPVWKSRAMLHEADEDVRLEYRDGRSVTLENVTVDSARGNLSTLAYWRMNEGTGTTLNNDSRDSVMALTFTDATRWREGRVGTGLQFSGSDGAIDVANSEMDAAAVSLLVWVKPDADPAGRARVLRYESAAGPKVEVGIGADLKPYALVDDAGLTYATAPDAVSVNVWTHLAATYEPGELKLYVNGELVEEATPTGALTPGAGTPKALIGGGTPRYTGTVDEVRLYRRALAEDEFSLLRWGFGTTWDAVGTGGSTPFGLASHVKWNGNPLNGSALYKRSAGAGGLDDAWLGIVRGVNNSTVAAYHNGSWSRSVPVGDEVAVEYDFRKLLDDADVKAKLKAGATPYVTVSVRGPVSQPPGTNNKTFETFNTTLDQTHGWVNYTLPRGSLFGSHVVVVTLNVTLEDGGDVGVLVRKVDYFNAVHPLTKVVPVNPVYRAVLELWVPEWR